ncbi:RNA polymerase II-associated protein 3 [Trametes pubescens]|uniref:RNA polymerase II-associated protein 3 n=1 Tax=Trametes pubescens TaxID=154538 RepID=A0A1M2W5S6_TRAPU|nr:RNA polymerase II-associated protein 3 [Trametes pubescens]
MPAKYSHVKKRPAVPKKTPSSSGSHAHTNAEPHQPNPQVDKSLYKATPAEAQLERTIARIILIRFEQDIVRLFSTHLSCVALLHLPTFVLRCVTVGGPSWVAANTDSDEIKDFFRGAIAMDLRQAGDRVATKSVLWTYTALRHFAKSNGVPICQRRGLHSHHLLPHYAALKAHLDTLEAQHPPPFAKPPHLGPMSEGIRALEKTCETKYGKGPDWRLRVREGYDRACATLWDVAREFDVRGYGLVLREKLTSNWCDCGCSTDHLGEVCEKTVRMEEEESGVRPGKEREWDGRGSGVSGWGTEEEENMWEVDFDFANSDSEAKHDPAECDMTVAELIEWRYLRAEREKEQGNIAFKKGEFAGAIERYRNAYRIEPELPRYQLNIAAACLKMNDYVEAEKACDLALGQHRSVKGYWRRAQARKAQGRIEDALKDLRDVLRLQPSNAEAMAEIMNLCPPGPLAEHEPAASSSIASSSSQPSSSSSSSKKPPAPSAFSSWIPTVKPPKPLPFPRTKTDDRKLKVSSIPITVDIPDNLPFFSSDSGVESKNKRPPSSSFSGYTIPQTFSYPCWERYMVQKISD